MPPLTSPEVKALCTVIVWYRPELPCDSIIGYNVRLFNPQATDQSAVKYVGANSTFYIIKDEDKLDINDAIHVQVCDLVSVILYHALHVPKNITGSCFIQW